MGKLHDAFKQADLADIIVRTLARDPSSTWVLPSEAWEPLREFKNSLEYNNALVSEQKRQEIIFSILNSFAAATDPTHGGKNKFISWIMKTYAQRAQQGNAIRSGDLYKIKDQLAYFETAKQKLLSQGFETDIQKYKSYDDFEKIITPLLQRHNERHLNPLIRNETTFLYEGPEGKIVVPHSKRASDFWGLGTKWCISSNTKTKFFENYNGETPIVIYAPNAATIKAWQEQYPKLTSFKAAATMTGMRDELDKRIYELPPYLDKLNRAGLEQQDKGLAEYIKIFVHDIEQNKQKDMQAPHVPHPSRIERIAFYFKSMNTSYNFNSLINKFSENPSMLHHAAFASRNNPDFVLEALHKNGDVLRCAAKNLLQDPQFLHAYLNLIDKAGEDNRVRLLRLLHIVPAFQGRITTNTQELRNAIGTETKLEQTPGPEHNL